MLIKSSQIESNLRRTASKGSISLLNPKNLEELSFKYFGIKDKDGNIIGYQCPYSGEIYTDYRNLVLEHMIPVNSNGGTVLFNCIPTSSEVNKVNEKGAKHLITWWTNSKYWNNSAIERLKKLLNYILEAYSIVFNADNVYTGLQSSEHNDLDYIKNDDYSDLAITQESEQELKDKNSTDLITYFQFLNDIIFCLKENNVDTREYEIKIKKLETIGIFNEIERISLIQETLKKIIKEKINKNDRSELTIILNMNIKRIAAFLHDYSDESIYSELKSRIDNIEKILNENNIGILSYFEDIKNLSNVDILFKNIADLTDIDINKFIEQINLCISDKFQRLLTFVETNDGKLPSLCHDSKYEKQLANLKDGIQQIQNSKNTINFGTTLSKEELIALHDSKYEKLRRIYLVILTKSIENNISIAYIDENLALRIREYKDKLNKTNTIEEEIELQQEYKDIAITNNQFNEFVNFVINNNGKLPSASSKDDIESGLANYRAAIQIILPSKSFNTKLNSKQLIYLHDSKYESLRNLYINILTKAIENNIEIDYIDENMALRIREYKDKLNKINTLEEEINLQQEYKDIAIINNQFNEFINFVINNNGKLPSKNSKNINEAKLGTYRTSIQTVDKRKGTFRTSLNKNQLEYLHNSRYESLNELYKVILNKSIENNISLQYIDLEIFSRREEYLKKLSSVSTYEEKINLQLEYKNAIVITDFFVDFVGFIISNDGALPSVNSKNETERTLGNFRYSIQTIEKNGRFKASLNKEQLKYLHDSNYPSLRNLYKTIMMKAVDNNIQIEYIDENMYFRIKEYEEKLKTKTTFEEEINLQHEYSDIIEINNPFNEFINYVLSKNGELPRNVSDDEVERRLGNFRHAIQTITKKGMFKISLNRNELKYLHDSEYVNLRNLYKKILFKSLENNIKIDYIDSNILLRMKEYNDKIKSMTTIEEGIELEQQYNDVVLNPSYFNKLIKFVIANNGNLPNKKSKNELEKSLGSFVFSIKHVINGKNVMQTNLNQRQLEYLYNSKYESLREVYDQIMINAYEANMLNYIEIDKKIKGLSGKVF